MLLVHHTYGRLNWELPGGLAELAESPIETAIREVKKEASLDVMPVRLTGIYYEPRHDFGEFIHFVFRCELADANQVPRTDGDEVSELQFWPLDALPRPISDFTIRRITDAMGYAAALPVKISERRWLEV